MADYVDSQKISACTSVVQADGVENVLSGRLRGGRNESKGVSVSHLSVRCTLYG